MCRWHVVVRWGGGGSGVGAGSSAPLDPPPGTGLRRMPVCGLKT